MELELEVEAERTGGEGELAEEGGAVEEGEDGGREGVLVGAGRGSWCEALAMDDDEGGEVDVAEAAEGAGVGVEEGGELGEAELVVGADGEGVAGDEGAQGRVDLLAVGAGEGELVLLAQGGLQGGERRQEQRGEQRAEATEVGLQEQGVGVGEGGGEVLVQRGEVGGVATGGLEGVAQLGEARVVAVEAGLALGRGDRKVQQRGEGAGERGAAVLEAGVAEQLDERALAGAEVLEAAGVVVEGLEDLAERRGLSGELGEQAADAGEVARAADAEAVQEVGPGGDVERVVAAAQASEAIGVGVREGGAAEDPVVAVPGGADQLLLNMRPAVAGEAAGDGSLGAELIGVGDRGEGEGLAAGCGGAEGGLEEQLVVVEGAEMNAHALDEGVIAGEAELVRGGEAEQGGEQARVGELRRFSEAGELGEQPLALGGVSMVWFMGHVLGDS